MANTGDLRLATIDDRRSVLVVDDHQGFRAMAKLMLQQAGFTVIEAATGLEATEIVSRTRPTLVLLDVQLPDIDGFEVARRIAAREQSPLVVLTSTRQASDYGEQVAASPAAGFLPKDQLSGGALWSYLEGGG